MRPWAVLLLLLPLAGCLSSGDDAAAPGGEPGSLVEVRGGAIDFAAVAANIGEPIVMEHDHNDALLHTGSHNLELVGYSALGVELGMNGFANFVLFDEPDGRTTAFIASDGDDRAGMVIADVTDPANMVPLGSFWLDGNNVQEVRVTPDGNYAALNVQALPTNPGYFATPDGLADCGACILLLDVRDRTAPRIVDALPVEVLGTHNMEFHVPAPGALPLLYYVGQPLLGTNPDPVGNRIGVAQLREAAPGVAKLVPQESFFHDTTNDGGRSFPHDISLAGHPLTGQTIGYVSHWEGGVVTFDLSTLASTLPGEIGVNAERDGSSALAIHWTVQEPQARADGRVIAWSAPEIGALEDGTGVIRAYDASDPAALRQVGTWELPGEGLSISGAGGAYILSPHVAMPDQATGLLAVAHYHAGIWVLDMTEPAQPRALGYYLPHGDEAEPYTGDIWWKKPNFDPTGYLPNAYMVRWHDGLLWASERGTGLYVLRYTGPVPGSVL